MTGLVTNTGLAAVVDALVNGDPKYLGWGSGAGQDVTATDLAAGHDETRTAATLAVATTDTADDTLRVTGTIMATEPRAVTEVGIFSDVAGATMEVYGDFPAISVVAAESVAFTIDVIVDQA